MISGWNAEVQLFNRVQSADSAGGLTTAWAATSHNCPAYMQTNTAAETVKAGGERSDFSGTAFFPGFITVNQGDRIVWAGRTLQVDAAHVTYRVKGFADFVKVEWSEVTNAGL